MARLHLNPLTGRMVIKAGPKGREHQAITRERAGNRRAIDKARDLAAEHGISVVEDTQGGWWVTCSTHFSESTDPLQGNNFCTSGREALEAVEAYVCALHERASAG